MRYGRKDCEHDWVFRADGYEEGCGPVICRKCGAFGCFCDIKVRPPWEYLYNNRAKSADNIGGNWDNPYLTKLVQPRDVPTGLCPKCGSKTTQPIRTVYCTRCDWKSDFLKI